MNRCDSRTSFMACFISSFICAYCVFKSRRVIFILPPPYKYSLSSDVLSAVLRYISQTSGKCIVFCHCLLSHRASFRSNHIILHNVYAAAFGTYSSVVTVVEIQPGSAPAYPAGMPCRITNHQRKIRHISGDHCASSDKGIHTDFVPAYDRCICANTGALSEDRFSEFIFPVDMTPRIDHIGKDRGGSDEDIIFTNDTCID